MNPPSGNGFAVENMFFSNRGWHVEFSDAATAKQFFDNMMIKSGWGLRPPDKQPATLEGTQVVFQTPDVRKIKRLDALLEP